MPWPLIHSSHQEPRALSGFTRPLQLTWFTRGCFPLALAWMGPTFPPPPLCLKYPRYFAQDNASWGRDTARRSGGGFGLGWRQQSDPTSTHRPCHRSSPNVGIASGPAPPRGPGGAAAPRLSRDAAGEGQRAAGRGARLLSGKQSTHQALNGIDD